MRLDEIATFVEAVERGSMSAAARALGVPRSTVSRRIARLEEALGQELVSRHARLFRVTEAGQALYRRTASAVRDLREAAHALGGGGPLRGRLWVSAPVDLGSSPFFADLLADFQAAYPEVRVDVDLSDRRVDLAAEGFDFALRAHARPLPDSSTLKARRLRTIVTGLYASPAWLARHGAVEVPEDLVGRPVVLHTLSGEALRLVHRDTGEDAGVAVPPAMAASSLGFMPAAGCAGLGVVPIPDLVAAPYVASGRLVRILDAWAVGASTLSLVWPVSRLPAPRRRAFLDFVVARLGGPSRGR